MPFYELFSIIYMLYLVLFDFESNLHIFLFERQIILLY